MELLVVVAILSVLAALLLPVLNAARVAAWGSGCVSNLKQLGYGFHLYAQDYDDLFPYAVDAGDANALDYWRTNPVMPDAYDQVEALVEKQRMLPVVMAHYTSTKLLWRCPADAGINYSDNGFIFGGGDTQGDTAFDALGMSYTYRTELGLLQKPMTSLREPSRVNVLMDMAGYWHSRFHRSPRTEEDTRDSNFWGYNVLFADGHVKNVTSSGYFEAWGYKLSDRDPFEAPPPQVP